MGKTKDKKKKKWPLILLLVVVVVVLLLLLFGDEEEENEWDEVAEASTTEMSLSEGQSDYGETGSSGYLEGNIVLFQAYVAADGREFDSEDAALYQQCLDIAVNYIESSAKQYGVDVNFIYDTEQHPELLCAFSYGGDISFTRDKDPDLNVIDDVYYQMQDSIDIQKVLKELGADQFIFVYVVDTDGGSFANPVYVGYDNQTRNNSPYEALFLYMTDPEAGSILAPATVAHETLHLFGAIDYYNLNEDLGVTQEFYDYMASKDDDIMFDAYDPYTGELPADRIPTKITEMTAYSLGWTDSYPEQEMFPNLQLVPGIHP